MSKHQEFRYKAKSDTVVVFIHGIQGSPSQFDYLIDTMNNKYSIANLLLPGHGRTAKDFAKSSMQEWQEYVDRTIAELEREYQSIVLAGHSMGGLLSVQTAISFPEKIKGLFLLALPLSMQMRFSYIKNNLIVGFTNLNSNEVICAARKANSISADSAFDYIACTPRYIELFRKSRAARKLIGQLKIPIRVLQSSEDEIVSKRSVKYLEGLSNVSIYIAENSGHYYYPKESQCFIENSFKDFLLDILPK